MEKGTSRKDILQLEKRLVDLELAITELKESAKSTDLSMVPELKQRMDDMEDLVMVEQAGIIELKKMMEEEKTAQVAPSVPPAPSTSPDLEQKIAGIEERLASLQVPTPPDTTGLQEQISKIEEKVASIQVPTNISGLQEQIQTIVNEITELRAEMNKEIDKLKESTTTGKQEISLQFLSSKFDSLKSTVDDFLHKKAETDLKIQSMENVVKEICNNTMELEARFGRIETLEKTSLLIQDLPQKLEQFQHIEDKVKMLSSRIETIYNNIDQKIEKIKDVGGQIPQMIDEIDRIRADFIKKVDKDEVVALAKRISSVSNDYKSFAGDVSKKLILMENIKPILEKKLDETTRRLEGKVKVTGIDEVNRILTDVTTKIAVIESKVNFMEKGYQRMVQDLSSKIQDTARFRESGSFLDEQLKDLINKMIFLESRLIAIERTMQESSRALPIIIE